MKQNLLHRRFGRLTVIGPARSRKSEQYWPCRCDCGAEIEAKTALLNRGTVRSCGCMKSDYWRERKTRHGLSTTSEHAIWRTMLARCRTPSSSSYARYGALGVTVCERWHDFENFFADMGPRPSSRHSLDRHPNPSGNYEPGNVRWATYKEQNRNRKSNRIVVVRGESMPLVAACEKYRADYFTAVRRLNRGLSVEQALGLAS